MRRLRPWSDDTGSIPLALLLSMIAVSLSALMTPMVLNQVDATRVDARRVHALHAAQAGLDIAMGQIRAAVKADGSGALSKLPCRTFDDPTFTGRVGAGGTARYWVMVDYFAEDPRGKDQEWIKQKRYKCEDTSYRLTSFQKYALLRAEGADATGTSPTVDRRTLSRRMVRGTYTFRTTNENIAGGMIHVYMTTSVDLCMDADATSPAAGTALRVRTCDATAASQRMAYNANLTIALVSSKTTALPLGMCLDAGTPANSGNVVRFQPCGDPATLPQQQWSTNDSANFEGTNPATLALSGLCFNVQSPDVSGSLVVLGGCGGSYGNVRTFSAEASVGAGAAGASSGQVVNFNQFGRCLDVTEFNVNFGYLIAWPCKQAPDATRVGWNQKWTMPTIDPATSSGRGQITTYNTTDRRTYCLTSPGSTGPGMYVTVTQCPATSSDAVTWTVTGRTDSYATSYVAVDYRGKCLQPTDPAAIPPDFYPNGLQISKIVVADCNGSTLQKWNAPANILQPLPLHDIGEK